MCDDFSAAIFYGVILPLSFCEHEGDPDEFLEKLIEGTSLGYHYWGYDERQYALIVEDSYQSVDVMRQEQVWLTDEEMAINEDSKTELVAVLDKLELTGEKINWHLISWVH